MGYGHEPSNIPSIITWDEVSGHSWPLIYILYRIFFTNLDFSEPKYEVYGFASSCLKKKFIFWSLKVLRSEKNWHIQVIMLVNTVLEKIRSVNFFGGKSEKNQNFCVI